MASHILEKDYIQALTFSKKSLVLAEQLGYEKGQAVALHNIGSSFNVGENYTIALEQIERALLFANKINDPFVLADINNTKGLLLLNFGYYDEALKIFQQSLQNLKKINPKHQLIGAVLHNIGFLYLKKDDNIKAIQFFDASINLENQSNSKIWLAQNYFDRAVAHKNLSNYNQAKADAILSIKISEQINDFIQIVKNLNLLGIIYLNFDNYKIANRLLKKGLELSIQHNLSQEKLNIYKSLSRLTEESKDYKRGFLIEKSYNKLYDSLYNKDRYRQLDEFRVYYGAMQKQKENIALKKANLSKEIKIQNKNYFLVAFIVLLVLTIYLLWMIFKRGRRMDKNNIVLTQQNEEINRQKKELEELNQWKSIFFSIVSHDLRSPILSLKGMLDLYHSNLLNEEELKLFMQELNKNFRNTASLMDNLLMWAKSQMQGQKLNKEEIDIYQITKDNIEVLQQKIDEKKLNFKNNIHIRSAYADEESISIVIRNLIANAIKFSKSGDEIIINSEKKGNNLIFCIKDNGLGMSLEQVTKVLSRVFYTTSGTKEEKGTGLGILLCDEFVRKNGGEFWIKSILGEGSSFYFSLPLRK
ncbi:MAG: tetratricopeptide repeat-containing sensor histidine kinase [Oligoflexus sp.]|nr:tetratricopeptide repeat-containing sensor histidine kinase [Pseudopedobacter sp.]